MINKRWYDRDPILKEALELLRLSPDATKNEAAEFMLQLQEQVAGEVIEHVYDIINTYQGKGNRWYDSDPMMLKAVELLRNAPPKKSKISFPRVSLFCAPSNLKSSLILSIFLSIALTISSIEELSNQFSCLLLFSKSIKSGS